MILATQSNCINTPSTGKYILPDRTARVDARSETTQTDADKGASVTPFHSNSSGSNSTAYTCTASDDSRDGHTRTAMLKGRIGFGPNLAFEFGKITTSGDHTLKEVGVHPTEAHETILDHTDGKLQ